MDAEGLQTLYETLGVINDTHRSESKFQRSARRLQPAFGGARSLFAMLGPAGNIDPISTSVFGAVQAVLNVCISSLKQFSS